MPADVFAQTRESDASPVHGVTIPDPRTTERMVRKGERFFAPTGFGDHDDSMDVVGHDNRRVQHRVGEMGGGILPTTPGDFAGIIQMHFAVHHMAEQARPVPRAHSHEIRKRMGGDGLAVGVGAILVIARIGPTAIVRANTRFAPTEGGRNGGGVCAGRRSLALCHKRAR